MGRSGLVIFEGGAASGRIEQQMKKVRRSVVLDTILKAGPIGIQIILVTDDPQLADMVRGRGVVVDFAEGNFHFGERLSRVIDRHGLEAVVYMGGAAAPLATTADLSWFAEGIADEGVVLMNNAVSADILGFSPASILEKVPLPESDNFLGWLLKEAGLRRVLPPNNPRLNFDLDTPTDYLILSQLEGLGPHTEESLRELNWPADRLLKALRVLPVKGAEVALIGRVGAPLIAEINRRYHCRLRVFSEERGMKSLGRDARGEVDTLIGRIYKETGAAGFFRHLSGLVQAVIFDTRVLLAFLCPGGVSPEDRYLSDLGLYDEITNPAVAEFTEAAVNTGIPVALGGHSLVGGGLWAFLEYGPFSGN